MKQALILFSLFVVQITSAQNDWRLYNDTSMVIEDEKYYESEDLLIEIETEGVVSVNSDPRIDLLITTLATYPPSINGYRVEIFFGKRKDAEKVKSEFLKHFDQWPIYIIWQQPNFKVQIGNFMTKLHAEKTKQEIKNNYPNAYITITEIKEAEL